jgi:hypothetical protein
MCVSNDDLAQKKYGKDQEKAHTGSKEGKKSRKGRAAKEVRVGLYERQASQNKAGTDSGWYAGR